VRVTLTSRARFHARRVRVSEQGIRYVVLETRDPSVGAAPIEPAIPDSAWLTASWPEVVKIEVPARSTARGAVLGLLAVAGTVLIGATVTCKDDSEGCGYAIIGLPAAAIVGGLLGAGLGFGHTHWDRVHPPDKRWTGITEP
jgi:hypothetical protein